MFEGASRKVPAWVQLTLAILSEGGSACLQGNHVILIIKDVHEVRKVIEAEMISRFKSAVLFVVISGSYISDSSLDQKEY